MGKIIGIDLGTTNSLVCVWRDGKAELVPNSLGEYLTPSAVYADEHQVLWTGAVARSICVSGRSGAPPPSSGIWGRISVFSLGLWDLRPRSCPPWF